MFELKFEHKIDYIMFVKDDDKTLKKNYVYIWSDNKGDKHIEVMGLPIIKSTATELGRLILEKHIKPRMLKELKGKFEKAWIMQLIKAELKDNISLMAQEYRCQAYADYSLKGKQSIWAQISKAYLEERGGYIKLIKNNVVGKVGNKDKYCTIEEAKKANLQENELDLTKVMNELKPFTIRKAEKSGGLFEY